MAVPRKCIDASLAKLNSLGSSSWKKTGGEVYMNASMSNKKIRRKPPK